uniref:Seroin 2 n=1 Tax=Bombyx mori TaxID=7091 RepID=Q8T7L7_BOMMO|nr:seroin 2 [Bombyx mori]
MAFTKFLFMLSLITIASAGFVWQDDNFPGFPSDMWPSIQIPTIPPFDPKIPNFAFSFPSPDNIKKTKPQPGQTYSGVYVSSNGGKGTMVANINGEVIEKKFGEDSKKSKSKS